MTNRTPEITHLTFSTSGGAGLSAKRLSQALSDRGIPSSVLTASDGDLWSKPFASPGTTCLAALDYFIVRKRASPSLLSLYRSTRGMKSIDVKQFQSRENAIVHLHWTPGLISLAQIETLVRGGTTVFWTLHDMWPLTGACHHSGDCDQYSSTACSKCPQAQTFSHKNIEREMYRKTSLLAQKNLWLIAPSNWMLQQALRHPSIDGSRIRVIPNVPLWNSQRAPQKEMLQRTRFNDGPITLLFVASRIHDSAKGLDDLIISIKAEHRLHSKVLLRVVGSGRPRRHFPWITYLGPMQPEELAGEYRSADLLVVPSRAENSPGIVWEALEQGLPVAARAVGDIPRMLEGIACCVLLQSQDDWGKCLVSLLENYPETGTKTSMPKPKIGATPAKSAVDQHLGFYKYALSLRTP